MRGLTALTALACWALASSAVMAEEAAPAAAAKEVTVTAVTNPATFEKVEIDMEIPIAAPPERVYEAFVSEIGRWWDKGFLMGQGSVDIVLEARPGGALMEVDGQGGGCLWAQVIAIYPGKSIRLGTPEGVVWAGAGYYRLGFDAAEDGTTLLKLHHESTQLKGEQGDGHSGYVYGWNALLVERLKPYCEMGSVPDPLRQ